MMIGQGAIANVGQSYYLSGRSLAGASEDLAALKAMRDKYGDGLIPKGNVDQIQDILATLVYPRFKEGDWQWCTLNNLLIGTPSEDDLSLTEEYMTEIQTLEKLCGDHAFTNQYKAALEELNDKGAPKEVTDWLWAKGNLRLAQKKKMVEEQAKENVDKAIKGTKQALNPFENPWVVGGIAAAITLLLIIRLKK